MAKKVKKQEKSISHGRLLIYLILVIVAVFMISKLDITGMASKTSISMIPTITAGETIYIDINTNGETVLPGISVYKNDLRFCQDCFDVCRESKCKGFFGDVKIDTTDGWVDESDNFKTAKFSIRVYNKYDKDYTEVLFNVKSKYEAAGVQAHR